MSGARIFLILALMTSSKPFGVTAEPAVVPDESNSSNGTVRVSLIDPIFGLILNEISVGIEYETMTSSAFGLAGALEFLIDERHRQSLMTTSVAFHGYPLRTAPHGWSVGLVASVHDTHVEDSYLGGPAYAYRQLSLALRTGYEFVFLQNVVMRTHAGLRYASTEGLQLDADLTLGWTWARTIRREPRPRPPSPAPQELGVLAGDPVKFLTGTSAAFLQASEYVEDVGWTRGSASYGGGVYSGFLVRAGYYVSIGLTAAANLYLGAPKYSVTPQFTLMIHPLRGNIAAVLASGVLLASDSIGSNVTVGVSVGRHLVAATWMIGINGAGHGAGLHYAYVW
jgi:hypothetical protein